MPPTPSTEAVPARRAAFYLRVSTREQDTLLQQDRLREVAERRGYDVVETYEDFAISGAKGRDQRPAFDKMLKDAVRGKFDVVMCWSIDRMGRSLQHLVYALEELREAKVDLYFDQQAIDTTTPAGRAFYGVFSIFSAYEREMMIERVRAGIAKAKLHGTRSGRPIGQQRRLSPRRRLDIMTGLAAGDSLNVVARRCGVTRSAVQRVRREMRDGDV